MIFDSILREYTLHEADNAPDPNQQQQQQNQNTADEGDNTAGNDDGDEYSMTDPDDEGGDEGTDTPPDDNQDQGTEEDTTDDTGEDDEYNITDPDEEGGDDQGTEDTADDSGEEDEYSMTDPDEEGTDDQGTDDTTTDENDPSAKLKELEKSIFDQLPQEMQQAKSTELKKLYNDTYDKCQSIIDIISTAEKQPNQVKVYDYILNNLLDLQRYIKDYLTNIYDSKTYIENMTELQKYLAILDTVNGVFEDMAKTPADDQDK